VSASCKLAFLNISTGKGRGKQVIATARTSDLILIVLDASKVSVAVQPCGAEPFPAG